MRAHQILGVPYTDDEVAGGASAAREQAQAIADEIVIQGGPEGLADKQIVALIAYLQRMGTDIMKTEELAVEEETGTIEAAAENPEPASEEAS
jgi:cytochrome c oxidase cbb3-type subunit I/II